MSAVLLAALLCVLVCAIPSPVGGIETSQPARGELQFTRDKGLQQVKPNKPVRVKLHRSAKGEYSWDLTGDNVDEVVKADKRLRKLLNIE
jgi:hypothetical protein